MKNLLRRAVILGLIALASSYTPDTAVFARKQPLDRNWQLSVDAADFRRDAKPAPAPQRWRGLIGEYGPDAGILYVLEKDGTLCALFKGAEIESLQEVSKNDFKFPAQGLHAGQHVVFSRDTQGRATLAKIDKVEYSRRQIEPENGAAQLHVKPLRPVQELLKEAQAAQPPRLVPPSGSPR